MNSVGKMGNLWEPDCAPSSPTKPLRQRFWKERWGNHFSSLLRRLAFRSLVSVVPVFSIWRVSTLLLILQWCLSDLPSKTSDLYTGKYGNPVCTRWDQLINPQKNLQQHLITFATVVMWACQILKGWDEMNRDHSPWMWHQNWMKGRVAVCYSTSLDLFCETHETTWFPQFPLDFL